jgi:hypothetical protein
MLTCRSLCLWNPEAEHLAHPAPIHACPESCPACPETRPELVEGLSRETCRKEPVEGLSKGYKQKSLMFTTPSELLADI